MNKYQKALGYIVDNFLDDIGVIYGKPNNLETECVMVIQELIDKETPMKPIGDYGIGHFCPNCKEPTIMFGGYTKVDKFLNRCENCGQRIDWGKHE